MEVIELHHKIVRNEALTFEFTSFTTLFSPYHAPKLSDSFSMVEAALAEHGISYTLNLVKRYIIVQTTTRSTDLDIIYRARDFILLLSRTQVPPSTAIKILNGNLHHEYIRTGHQEGGLCAIHGIKEKRFAKQRNRFLQNLIDLANLLSCNLYVNGNSVTVARTSLGNVKVARKAVERCFVENVNPATLVWYLKMGKEEIEVEGKLQALHI